MWKTLAIIGLANVFCGCQAQTSFSARPVATVVVDGSDRFYWQGFTFHTKDLGAFVKLAGDEEVHLVGMGSSLQSAVVARDELRAAGVKRVTIGQTPGG